MEQIPDADGQRFLGTQALSYCSRLTDAASFGQVTTLETHRRGTLASDTVVAVNDGAVWIQELLDLQCPQAVRILDLPHAVEHLAQVAHARWEAESPQAAAWLEAQVDALLNGQEAEVLARLAALGERCDLSPETLQVAGACHGYLARRRDQIRYAAFRAAGYPVGSGCVESANKLLVEARLKGAGMHWRRGHVNALLALRCLERNGRWNADWPALWQPYNMLEFGILGAAVAMAVLGIFWRLPEHMTPTVGLTILGGAGMELANAAANVAGPTDAVRFLASISFVVVIVHRERRFQRSQAPNTLSETI